MASGDSEMRARNPRMLTIEIPEDDRGNPIPPLERLTVRVPEAAQVLSISRAAVYRLIATGELQVAKNGQKTLVIVASLKAFVERNRV
jgi:excisionase family DNA binding protein